VCENRVLERVIAPKRWEVTGGLRNLHIGELHDLYAPILRWFNQMRWASHVAHLGEIRNDTDYRFD
jgi:hypothetical protein